MSGDSTISLQTVDETPSPRERVASGSPATLSTLPRIGLTSFFFLANYFAIVLRIIRPIAIRLALFFVPSIVRDTSSNFQCLTGEILPPARGRNFARAVLGNFYDFVIDVARSGHQSATQILTNVAEVKNESAYHALRKRGGGAVLVTVHAGSFEVGLAALRQFESSVHVVFKRDRFDRFEQLRTASRSSLGVNEAPIDDGLPALMKLRDALLANGVVVMQGDRAFPGQKSQVVPFGASRLRLPIGPIKLARLTGSPIVPVFVARVAGGKFDVHLGDAIEIDPHETSVNGIDPTVLKLATAMESFLRQHPEQWLALEKMFVEDSPSAQ